MRPRQVFWLVEVVGGGNNRRAYRLDADEISFLAGEQRVELTLRFAGRLAGRRLFSPSRGLPLILDHTKFAVALMI